MSVSIQRRFINGSGLPDFSNMTHENTGAAEADCRAVPLIEVRRALAFMEYGSVERVMFGMLFYTGCRISELDGMRPGNFRGSWFYWSIGKNQRGFRRELLPEAFLKELGVYRANNRVFSDRLFGVKGTSFSRRFNRFVRPKLAGAWLERRVSLFRNIVSETEFLLQLKGLRKTFQTFAYADELKRCGDPGVALQAVSKRMRHSSERITFYHYIENFKSLGIPNDGLLNSVDACSLNQTRILDYC